MAKCTVPSPRERVFKIELSAVNCLSGPQQLPASSLLFLCSTPASMTNTLKSLCRLEDRENRSESNRECREPCISSLAESSLKQIVHRAGSKYQTYSLSAEREICIAFLRLLFRQLWQWPHRSAAFKAGKMFCLRRGRLC